MLAHSSQRPLYPNHKAHFVLSQGSKVTFHLVSSGEGLKYWWSVLLYSSQHDLSAPSTGKSLALQHPVGEYCALCATYGETEAWGKEETCLRSNSESLIPGKSIYIKAVSTSHDTHPSPDQSKYGGLQSPVTQHLPQHNLQKSALTGDVPQVIKM